MNNDNNLISRRGFLRNGTAIATAIPIAVLMRETSAAGAQLDLASPQAIALGYQSDGSLSERASAEDSCATCSQFAADDGKPSWGSCTIFPGKLVNGKGWCRVYNKK